MKKIDVETKSSAEKNFEILAKLFPSCVIEGTDVHGGGDLSRLFSLERLQQLLNGKAYDESDKREEYTFSWVGKRKALSESMSATDKTLRPCKEESKNWETTQNLYIEGDNLDALKLLQESYWGKVKMIYIDPPYNTGNDFIFRDSFTQDAKEYEAESGIRDEDGERMRVNHESDARFHSIWCSMIYARLRLARNLLTEDGVIFISIDDNEVADLRKICDEIFGESKRYSINS